MEILKKVDHESMLNFGSKNGFRCNQREESTEECIGSLDIWDYDGRMVSCKVLGMVEDALHAVEICSCVIW